jgi:hypothetical protein
VDRHVGAHAHAPVDLDEVHAGERLLDLPDLLHREGRILRLLHDADLDAVGDDVGLLRRTVLDPRRVDGGAVLRGRFARLGQGAQLVAGEILQDRSRADGSRMQGLDSAHVNKSFVDRSYKRCRGKQYLYQKPGREPAEGRRQTEDERVKRGDARDCPLARPSI